MARLNKHQQETVRAIKRLKREGTALNYGAVHKSHYTMVAKATERFGSWGAAIDAAGLDYREISKLRRWTKKAALGELRHLHKQGKVNNVNQLYVNYPKLFAACRRHFGTGRLAFEAAGIDYEKLKAQDPRNWTKARIVKEVKQRYADGKTLMREVILRKEPKLQRFCNAALYRFGSWGAALRAAGLDPAVVRNRDALWPRERVLEEICSRHEKGKLLNTEQMMREQLRLHAAGKRHFGSWQKAVEKAGINYRQHVRGGLRGYTRARTRKALRKRAEDNRCVQKLVREESPALYRAAIHYYGSWEEALRAIRRRR